MSKSPLAGAFTENGAPAKKKNKKAGALLILAGVALTTSLGGVFAANITIASNGIEFGQGVAAVNTCDTAIDTSVEQTYNASHSGGATFEVSRVALSGINNASDHCGGKTVHVALLNSSGTAICAIAGTDNAATVTLDGSNTATTTSDSITIPSGSATNAVIRVTATSGSDCVAASVDKVTLTTSN